MSLLVTFFSVSAALYTQKLLAGQQVQCVVVPVPRSVSSSCGYALETSGLPAAALVELMDKKHVEWETLYQQAGDETAECYEQVVSSTREGLA